MSTITEKKSTASMYHKNNSKRNAFQLLCYAYSVCMCVCTRVCVCVCVHKKIFISFNRKKKLISWEIFNTKSSAITFILFSSLFLLYPDHSHFYLISIRFNANAHKILVYKFLISLQNNMTLFILQYKQILLKTHTR